MVEFDVGQSFLDDRQVLESQEVHLNQSSALNHAALILGNDDVLAIVVGRGTHGHPVGDVVASDDHATGMDTGAADATFKFLGKADGLGHARVFTLHFLLEVGETLQAVAHGDFIFLTGLLLGHLIGARGDKLGQTVALS